MGKLVIVFLLLLAMPFSYAEDRETDKGILVADTILNGCAGLPITWTLTNLKEESTEIIYTVYNGKDRVYTSDITVERTFSFTPETGGVYSLQAKMLMDGQRITVKSVPIDVSDKLYMGKFEQNYDAGELEPIEWRVLAVEDGKALVITEYAICNGSYFNPKWIKYKYTYWSGSRIGECGWNNDPGKGETRQYRVTPTTVPLKDGSEGTDDDLYYVHARYWLNGEFYESAFTSEERQRILLTVNENKDNPVSHVEGGEDTLDYIFFISYDEFKAYFATNVEARCLPTLSTSMNHYEIERGTPCYWWLRTPGEFRCNAMYVNPNGNASTYGSDVGHDSLCYRPAMWITIGD